MDMNMQQPGAMPGPDGDEAGGEQGYCVMICVYPDGGFGVTKHPLPEEAAEQGGPGVMPERKVASLGEALKAAIEIIKQNPVSGEAGAQFQAGLQSEAPANMGMR